MPIPLLSKTRELDTQWGRGKIDHKMYLNFALSFGLFPLLLMIYIINKRFGGGKLAGIFSNKTEETGGMKAFPSNRRELRRYLGNSAKANVPAPCSREDRKALATLLRNEPLSGDAQRERSLQAQTTVWAALIHGLLVTWALSSPVSSEPIERAEEARARGLSGWCSMRSSNPKNPVPRLRFNPNRRRSWPRRCFPQSGSGARQQKSEGEEKAEEGLKAKKAPLKKETPKQAADALKAVSSVSENAPVLARFGRHSRGG